MPERLNGRLFWRTGSALALAVGSTVLAGEAHETESIPRHEAVNVGAVAFSDPALFRMERDTIEPTTTTLPPPTTTMTPPPTTPPVPITTEASPPPREYYPVGCENYRELVAQYSWPVDGAMRTMSEESGCDPNAISATDDHGLFQLHGQPVYDPAENIRIAYGMYVDARRGANNFSAWYAVCTPDQQPKYPEVNCS